MWRLFDPYAMALSLLVGGVGFGMTFFFNTNYSEWGAQEIAYPAMAMVYVYARNARFNMDDKSRAQDKSLEDAMGGAAEATPAEGHQLQAPFADASGVKLVVGDPLSPPAEGTLVVVFFWATWCANSQKCLPAILSTASRYHSEGIKFAIVTQESEDDLRYFVETYHRPLRSVTLLADEHAALTKGYQGAHGIKTIPHCYIVRGGANDSAGGEKGAGFGLVQWHGHPTRLEATLDYMLEDESGSSRADESGALGDVKGSEQNAVTDIPSS